MRNPAIVYVCLVVREHFITVAEEDLAFSGVSFSRAILCEILATKLVHHFASNQIELVSVLTASWSPLAGAADDVIEDVKSILRRKDNRSVDDLQSALEVSHRITQLSPCVPDGCIQDGNLFKSQKVHRLSDSPICRKRYLLRPGRLLVVCKSVHRRRYLQAPCYRDL